MARANRAKLYPQAIEQAFCQALPAFAKESAPTRAHLTLLMISAYRQKRFQHHRYEGQISIYSRSLDEMFGRSEFAIINRRVGLFEIEQNYSFCASGSPGWTRGYKLTASAEMIMESVQLQQTHMVDEKGVIVRTPETLAIAKKDERGNHRAGRGNIPAVVNINVDELLKLQAEARAWKWHYKDGLPAPTTGRLHKRLSDMAAHVDRLQWLEYFIIQPITHILLAADTIAMPKGCTEVTYTEYPSGRLYSNQGYLQTACREIRAAAFSGCWDYDFSACHFALISQLSARIDQPTPTIDAYLWQKAEIRQHLAAELDVPLKAIKVSLTALIYGAPRKVHSFWKNHREVEPAILKNMGGDKEKARRFFEHPIIDAMHEEIQRVRDKIIAAAPTHRGRIINALGKSIEPKKHKPYETLSHLLQGAESAALHAVIQSHGQDLILLMHDGWISRQRLDCDQLTDEIHRATGFLLDIEEAELK